MNSETFTVQISFDTESMVVMGEAESGNFDVPLAEYVRPQRESDLEDDVDEALALAGLERVAPRFFGPDDFSTTSMSDWVGVVVRRIEGDSAA